MLFDTFSTQAAQASLDALWLKTRVISNNMANADTPGYKSQRVSFQDVLNKTTKELSDSRKASAAQGEGQSSKPTFRTTVNTDKASSVRLDGNNVSLEREQTELWKSYAQYSNLLDRFASHYNNINAAITGMKG